jgi:hypothetical protein
MSAWVLMAGLAVAFGVAEELRKAVARQNARPLPSSSADTVRS